MRRARSEVIRPARLRAVVLAVTGLAAGCAGRSVPDTSWPVAARPDEARAIDARGFRELVEVVSAARGLAETRRIHVKIVDRDVYEENLRGLGMRSQPGGPPLAVDEVVGIGFDFLPPPGVRDRVPDAVDLRLATSAGVYIVPRDLILLPRPERMTRRAWRTQRDVLAHEVQHALQARHFPDARRSPASLDAGLAHRALVEGDATATMVAFSATERGVPVARALRGALRLDDDVPAAGLAHRDAAHRRRIVGAATPEARAALAFPYVEGTLFVADLFRAGGFPLVDRAFATPPTTTEQVLHPAKYFAGEDARPVAALPPPPGHTAVHGDALGELHARTLFRRCATSEKLADAAAAGWGGDRFEVFVGPGRELVVAWVSAWDTEDDAREVEALLAARRTCWSANVVEHADGAFTIGPDVRVRRDGAVVTLVRGGAGSTLDAWTRSLARVVGEAPPRRPRFDVEYRPRAPLPTPDAGMIEGDTWTSEWLGLVVPRPEGARWERPDATTIVARRDDARLRAVVGYSTRSASPRFLRQTLDEWEDALAHEYGRRMRPARSSGVKTHLGSGVQRVWDLDAAGEIRVIVLPVCRETGAIVIVRLHVDGHGDEVLDDWFRGIHWIRDRDIPACAYLDPR